jgi:hypothetical protein
MTGGMQEQGWGWWRDKKFSAVKISVCGLGACGSDGLCLYYFSGWAEKEQHGADDKEH